MPDYDTNSTLGQPVFSPKGTHFPFEVMLRVVPDESGGRRHVTQRSGQRTAAMLQNDLVDAGWNIAIPLTYVPAYGNRSAKIKLRGFFEEDIGATDPAADNPVFKPTQPITKIHTGTIPGEKTALIEGDGGGGNLGDGQNPITATDNLCVNLLIDLQADSTLFGTSVSIERVDLMGVYYGKGARSFP